MYALDHFNTGYQWQFSWRAADFFIGRFLFPSFAAQRENPVFKQDAEQDVARNLVGNILPSEPELEHCLSIIF